MPSDGRVAFNAGLALSDNPHPFTDPEHSRWRAAWLDAKEDAS